MSSQRDERDDEEDYAIPTIPKLVSRTLAEAHVQPEALIGARNFDRISAAMDAVVPTDMNTLLAMVNVDRELLSAPLGLFGKVETLADAIRAAVFVRLDEAVRTLSHLATAESIEDPEDRRSGRDRRTNDE